MPFSPAATVKAALELPLSARIIRLTGLVCAVSLYAYVALISAWDLRTGATALGAVAIHIGTKHLAELFRRAEARIDAPKLACARRLAALKGRVSVSDARLTIK